jgi:hypothetical protein
MKNLNEPLKNPSQDLSERARSEADVVAFRRDKISERGSASMLIPENERQTLHSRWDAVQSMFVDDPRRAVEDADEIVSNAIQRLTQSLSDECSKLKAQLKRGDETSTEDLRIVLQRYRALFSRLVD